MTLNKFYGSTLIFVKYCSQAVNKKRDNPIKYVFWICIRIQDLNVVSFQINYYFIQVLTCCTSVDISCLFMESE